MAGVTADTAAGMIAAIMAGITGTGATADRQLCAARSESAIGTDTAGAAGLKNGAVHAGKTACFRA
jgi:hypothetical protein